MALPPTLPDLLRDGLDVVFVGINPSLFSVARGHYFARASNRFWPSFSRSRLSAAARAALNVARLEPAHDRLLLEHGFGFTDMAKRATARASELLPGELGAGARRLLTLLELHQPRVACFHGVTGYRPLKLHLEGAQADPSLGAQSPRIGRTRLFVVPNPSGLNAHFTPADQTDWYDRLHRFAAQL